MIGESNACRKVPSASAGETDIKRDIRQPDDLASRVVRSLFAHGGLIAGIIEVTAKDGTVTVRGQVPDGHVKRRCLDCCRHVAGVNKLIDQLEVRPSSQNGLLGASGRRSEPSESCR
jgi:osmotically-inducible protein OsmY